MPVKRAVGSWSGRKGDRGQGDRGTGRRRDRETERRRDGETEGRRDRAMERQRLLIAPSLCLSVPPSLCLSVSPSLRLSVSLSLRPSVLFSAFHLLNHLRCPLHPFLAFIAEANAFKGQHSIDADDPVARDAVNAEAFGVRLRRDDRERILVLLHKR